jgi:hypothetical protein
MARTAAAAPADIVNAYAAPAGKPASDRRAGRLAGLIGIVMAALAKFQPSLPSQRVRLDLAAKFPDLAGQFVE